MTTVEAATKPSCGPKCCTYPCEHAPTTEALARQALETLIERHDLPRPPRIYWREEPGEVRVAFDTDADVDRWATTLFRTAHADFGGWDNTRTPGAWSVSRHYGFRIRRWMGIGVSLEVFHAETRTVPVPGQAVTP